MAIIYKKKERSVCRKTQRKKGKEIFGKFQRFSFWKYWHEFSPLFLKRERPQVESWYAERLSAFVDKAQPTTY
jgi:hypothetical protein